MSKWGGLDFWIPWTREFHVLSSISAGSLWGPQSPGPSTSRNSSFLTHHFCPHTTSPPNTKFSHSFGFHNRKIQSHQAFIHTGFTKYGRMGPGKGSYYTAPGLLPSLSPSPFSPHFCLFHPFFQKQLKEFLSLSARWHLGPGWGWGEGWWGRRRTLSPRTDQGTLPKHTRSDFSKRNSAIKVSPSHLYWWVEENKIHSS